MAGASLGTIWEDQRAIWGTRKTLFATSWGTFLMPEALHLSAEIRHVTDTARLVAAIRAEESERQNRLFNDRFARRLAGPGIEELLKSLPNHWVLTSAVVFRTVLMDEIILRLVLGHQIDTVISLGAGLDTRPFRLELGPTLRWVDVDMPEVLEYKHHHLAGEPPQCIYNSHGLDLGDRANLRHLLQKMRETGGRTLVLTEGLLYYLKLDHVTALAEDIREVGVCDYWLSDVVSKQSLWWLQKSWAESFGSAQMHFATRRGHGTFLDWGYRVLEQCGLITEGLRRGRFMSSHKYLQLIGARDKIVSKMLLDELARVVLLRRIGATELPPPES